MWLCKSVNHVNSAMHKIMQILVNSSSGCPYQTWERGKCDPGMVVSARLVNLRILGSKASSEWKNEWRTVVILVQADRKVRTTQKKKRFYSHVELKSTSKPWNRWATRAKDHTGYHSCLPRKEIWGYSGYGRTKTRQPKMDIKSRVCFS